MLLLIATVCTLAYAGDAPRPASTCVAVPVPVTPVLDSIAVASGVDSEAKLREVVVPAGFAIVGVSQVLSAAPVVVACRSTTEAERASWAKAVVTLREEEAARAQAETQARCARMFDERTDWTSKGWPASSLPEIPRECDQYDPLRVPTENK